MKRFLILFLVLGLFVVGCGTGDTTTDDLGTPVAGTTVLPSEGIADGDGIQGDGEDLGDEGTNEGSGVDLPGIPGFDVDGGVTGNITALDQGTEVSAVVITVEPDADDDDVMYDEIVVTVNEDTTVWQNIGVDNTELDAGDLAVGDRVAINFETEPIEGDTVTAVADEIWVLSELP